MESSTAGMVKDYWRRLARSRRRSLALLCIGIPAVLFGTAAWYDHEVSLKAAREQVSAAADGLAEHARSEYRRVEHQPLYAVFALDRQAYLRPWYWRVVAWAAFAALAGAAMFLAMDQVMRRLETEKEQLKLLLAEGERRREAESRLLQSQKFEALGQVTGGVAHDFNNLLAAITAALAMLRKRTSDGKELELLTLAEEAAAKGAKITQQMLAFARRESI
jgi:signal transduction histidine kinase